MLFFLTPEQLYSLLPTLQEFLKKTDPLRFLPKDYQELMIEFNIANTKIINVAFCSNDRCFLFIFM